MKVHFLALNANHIFNFVCKVNFSFEFFLTLTIKKTRNMEFDVNNQLRQIPWLTNFVVDIFIYSTVGSFERVS